MIRFTFVLLGIVFAFAAAGIQMDKLAILMGALGVGIGFGLQNIINNFVSGIILAMERPIKIGDKLDIPGVSGIVKDIGVRASTVRTWDGSDVIIPNGELISNKLTNWTFFDRTRRIVVEIRVPFDTDIESLSKLLLDTAKGIPEVMKKPSPSLNFKGIGTSAMEVNLYCWISNNDNFFTYGTSIRRVIFKALQDAGYDIPVPQQDVRINPENPSPGK
jgi:small-conductance mechanosensitive channel